MGKPLKDGLGHADLTLSKWILKTVDFWHDIGATPNTLTTLGVLSSAAALYYMYKGSFHGLLPFAILRWYFDYADGILARKYDQVTVFGDYYDHTNDLIFVGGIFIIFLLKSKKYGYVAASIFALFVVLNLIQTGCIEKETDAEEEDTLSKFKSWCVAPKSMKYLDTTTLSIVAIVLITIFVSNEYNIFKHNTSKSFYVSIALIYYYWLDQRRLANC